MNKCLKPVEEHAVNVVFIYEGVLDNSVLNNIFRQIISLYSQRSLRRLVVHVFSNRGNPHYLDDFKEFIQSNILFTLTIRFHNLVVDEVGSVLESIRKSNVPIHIFIDKNLVDYINYLREKGFEYTVI